MKKQKLLFLLVLLFAFAECFSQNVVNDIKSVKRPTEGKLYFQKKDKSLYLYRNGKFEIDNKFIQDTLVTVPPVLPIAEIEIGYWDIPERILISKWIGGKYYLMQSDKNRSYYVPRGKNLLSDQKTIIKTGVNVSNIQSADSQLGGLYAPDNFPVENFIKLGYKLNEKGEYVSVNAVPVVPPIIENSSNDFVDLGLKPNELKSIANNTFDWMQFNSLELPKGHLAVLGYGSPIYKTGLKNGKLPYFDAGWTHAVNIERLPMNYWTNLNNGQLEAKNTYYFQQYSHLVNRAAQSASNWWNPEWGNISGLWNGTNHGLDYSGIKDEGALTIGKIIGGNNSVARNNETGQWNVKTKGNYLMMDEEEYRQYPNYWSFMGKVAQGITEANPDLNVMLYGPPVSYFIHANNWSENLSDQKIEEQLKSGLVTFDNSGFRNAKTIFDLSMGYYKVPGIETQSKYVKQNGTYVIKHGKRVYRTDNFTENYFGQKVEILSEPHEWLKHNLRIKDASKIDESKGFYNQLFGKQYFNGLGSIKSEYRLLYEDISRKPTDWRSESEYAVRQEYKYVNGVLMKMILLNRLEFGDYNLNDYRERKFGFGVVRRWRTEPFTEYGNHIDRREIGPDLVFWDVAFSYCAGITTLEAWEDGLYLNNLPESGQKLYGEDENYGRYQVATYAMQKVFKPFENLPVENTRFLHFYRPFKSEKNSEAIVAARYNGSKMVLVARNPTLDPDEKQTLVLNLKNKVFNIELIGNKTKLIKLSVPDGLKPEESILTQTNIYGEKIIRNGVSSWSVKN